MLSASGAIALSGCGQSSSSSSSSSASVTTTETPYDPLGNYPVASDQATFACLVPESGLSRSIGAAYRDGFELAINHLNTGGPPLNFWPSLSGTGVQNRRIEMSVRNTASDPSLARQQAIQLINTENAQMITGGASSSTVLPVLRVCQQQRIPFLHGIAHTNSPSGRNCVRYGFREMINVRQTAAALAHFFEDRLPSQPTLHLLYAGYTWGQTQRAMFEREFSRRDLDTSFESQSTIPAQSTYRDHVERISTSTDLLCIIQRGLDATTVLEDVSRIGLDANIDICIPLWSRLTAQTASEHLESVYGTVPWNWQLRNQVSIAFLEAFRDQYNRTPSYESLIGYIQPLQYAAAVERAETFYPPAVIRQLEDHRYDNAGLGSRERLRACDHQAQRDVPIVSGRPVETQQTDQFFKLETVVKRDNVQYECDQRPASNCELGSYS